MDSREPVTMTREELYLKVWSTPMRTLAKEYGLSDVGMAKICKKYNIPRPPVGYWAKVAHGKKVKQPPLPKGEASDQQTIHMFKYSPNEVPIDPRVSAIEEQEQQPEWRIEVAAALSDPHPLVERTLKSLSGAGADGEGYVRPRAKTCLDVRVSRDSVDRAMRIMDALIKALERRGHAASVVDSQSGRSTIVTVLSEAIAIALCSYRDRREHQLTRKEQQDLARGWAWRIPKYDYFASDQLELCIVGGPERGYRKTYGDGKKQRVEDCLNKFVTQLLMAAEETKAVRRENERQAIIRREEERRQQEAAKAREMEEKYLKWLVAEVDGWVYSQRIRAYLCAVREAAVEQYGSIHPESRLANWLAWAEEQADRQDPLIRTPESPMDHDKPFSYSYRNDKFEWLRVENGLFLNPANAKAPASEAPDDGTGAAEDCEQGL